MTTTTNTFQPVESARLVEYRAFRKDEEPHGFTQTAAKDFDTLLAPFAGIEHAEVGGEDEIGPVDDRSRVTRFARVFIPAAADADIPGGTFIEVRERRVYHGLYQQVEELRRWLNRRNEIVTSREEADELIEDARRALEDVLAHDRYERDALAREGHCRHGVYVGGCGIDWMCGPCEDGSE